MDILRAEVKELRDLFLEEAKTIREAVHSLHSCFLTKEAEVNLKVDRLEQIESNRKWTIRAILGSIIAIVSKIAADTVFHSSK